MDALKHWKREEPFAAKRVGHRAALAVRRAECSPVVVRERLLLLSSRVAQHIAETNATLGVARRSSIWAAQIIALIDAKRGQRGVIYERSRRDARRLVALLRRVGFTASTGSIIDGSFRETTRDNVVVVGGERPEGVGYVLHASPPTSLDTYVAEVRAWSSPIKQVHSMIYYDDGSAGVESEGDMYCRSWTCRHAQLVRRLTPSLIEPPLNAFCCYRCDVCLAEPHGVHEEESAKLVTVNSRPDPFYELPHQ